MRTRTAISTSKLDWAFPAKEPSKNKLNNCGSLMGAAWFESIVPFTMKFVALDR
jgi:hypothetical protein